MKRSELVLTFLQVPLDFVALVAAGWTAYAVRFSDYFVALKTPLFNFSASWYLSLITIVALGWLIIFAFAGLYSINPNRKLGADVGKIFLACGTALGAVTIYIFFRGELFNSRFIVLVAWGCAIIYTIISHTLIRLFKIILYKNSIGARQTVLIGKNGAAAVLKKTLTTHKGLGYAIVEQLESFSKDGSLWLVIGQVNRNVSAYQFTGNEWISSPAFVKTKLIIAVVVLFP